MATHEHDYTLLGINADDTTYISGPFEHALAVLRMLAHNIVNDESVAAAVAVHANPESDRASLLITFNKEGEQFISAYMLLPIPRMLNQDDLHHLTDLGLWEAEMNATSDIDDSN